MFDFEKLWLGKLSVMLEKLRGGEFSDSVMKSARNQTDTSPEERTISWTAKAAEKLSAELTEKELHEVFTGCSCHYPPGRLAPIRDAFLENRSFPEALALLRDQFIATLRDGMMLDDEVIQGLLDRGMGPAGVLEENRIVATKIPKSRNLRAWLAEDDPDRKRELYCHCPRINRALELGVEIPVEYCLCGAGFYRNIWETITGEPVRVEVMESVQKGDDVCRIAVYPDSLKA